MPKTFAWYVNKGLLKAALITCLMGWVLIYLDIQPNPVPAQRPNAVNSPAAFMDEYNCWGNPNGRIPGHVVMREPDGNVFVGGPDWVGIALNQHMGVTDTDYHIYSFCP